MKRYTLAALALLLVLLPSQQALRADQALYVIQDLGLTPDGLAPTVTGVNAKGQLSGYVSDTPDGNPRAVRFTDGFGWQYLTGLDAAYSVATGINKDGALVGYHLVGSRLLAFRYTDNGGVEDILPIGSGDTTLGFAINDAGEVVGSSSTQGLPSVAFRAAVGTAALAVPPLSKACGINAAGVIVGFGPASHALLYQSETNIIDLGSFEGDAGFSDACAIDENGRVGGWATDAGVGYAFDYAGTVLQRVESFGGVFSKTEAIASGRSVGWFMLADGTMHAFTHSDADGAIDLNAGIAQGGGWVLSTAKGINAAGQIVGEGTKNGNWTTFRLTVAATKDTTAPVFTSLSATPSIIFPPKGQKVTVTVTGTATDDSGAMPVCKLATVSGPGSAGVDYDVTGANTAAVLAVGGRTYTLNEVCVDGSNNAAFQAIAVTVPADITAPAINELTATPSRISPPNGQLVPVSVAVLATDDVDDQPMCALTGIAAPGATSADLAITGQYSGTVRAVGGRTYALTVSCFDAAGNRSARSVNVVVPPDTTAPVICALSATPSFIWPPNGKMVPVAVSVTAKDDLDSNPTCSLTSVTGGEAVVTGPFTASVRASKNNDGNRIYVLQVSCSDRAHNTSVGTVTVTVTKDDPAIAYVKGPGKGGK